MAGTKMLCSRNWVAAASVLASSPKITGMMALMNSPGAAAGLTAAATSATRWRKAVRRVSPSGDCASAMPAVAAAAAAGTGAVEKIRLRARFTRKSISTRLPQM